MGESGRGIDGGSMYGLLVPVSPLVEGVLD